MVGNPEVIQRDLLHHFSETLAVAFRPRPISRSSGPSPAVPGFNFRMPRDPSPSGRHMPSLMVRYDTLSDEWESPHDGSRFSQDCPEPGRRGRVPSRGITGFSCKRQEICFARVASRGLWKSDAYAGAAGSVCGGRTRDFPADSWWLGKDGTHAYSPGGGKRGCTDGCTPNGVETAN